MFHNPHLPVVIPSLEAGCSLADGCPIDQFLFYRQKIVDSTGVLPVTIAYINCSAEIKANVDVICTSSNASKILEYVSHKYPERPIFFVPDQYLGTNLAHLLKKEIFRPQANEWPSNPHPSAQQMYLFQGSCIVHEQFSAKRVIELKKKYPQSKVLAHSECLPEVVALADVVGSTTALLKAVQTNPSKEFIILTEAGILHQMKKLAPEKLLIPGPTLDETCSCNECPFMKKNTLDNLLASMETMSPQIHLEESIRLRALKSLETMLSVP
ncbi:MAG: quinolinate synthase [Planctomycetota bacterium]